MIHLSTYQEFAQALESAGFMTLSRNPLGIPNLSVTTLPEQWHTGLDTDPWQWKSRVVMEKRAAYAKLFFGSPSFVTAQWYPVLLAVRRTGTFEEAWENGVVSAEARRIYDLFSDRKVLAVHEIKRMAGFSKASAGKYESAMAALQAGMWLTVSGMTRMATADGRPHSWPVTEYMRVEDWAWPGTMEQAEKLTRQEAVQQITERILQINPDADSRAMNRFLFG